jgi:hypothetical protein
MNTYVSLLTWSSGETVGTREEKPLVLVLSQQCPSTSTQNGGFANTVESHGVKRVPINIVGLPGCD